MTTDQPNGAALSTERVGDVVSVQFAGEEEFALFIPESGDVLLCTAAQWRGLQSDVASDLKSMLLNLGARLA